MWSGGFAVQRQPLRVELDRVHAEEMVHGETEGLSPGAADVVWAAGCVPGKAGHGAPKGLAGCQALMGSRFHLYDFILSPSTSLLKLRAGYSTLGSNAEKLWVTVADKACEFFPSDTGGTCELVPAYEDIWCRVRVCWLALS